MPGNPRARGSEQIVRWQGVAPDAAKRARRAGRGNPDTVCYTKAVEHRTLVEAIGRTPLVRVGRTMPKGSAEILLKMEKLNPGGSLRDRVVRFALEQAVREDRLAPRGPVVAAAGEDGAWSAAMICAVRAHPLELFMPANTRAERRRAAARFGAKVLVVDGTIDEARAAAAASAKSRGATLLDVESAAVAARACAEIGVEILEATGDVPIDAFVATVRSGGTLEGVMGVMHTRYPKMAVHPVRLEGFSRAEFEGMVDVTRDDARAAAIELARKEGLLVGPATGAAFTIGRKLAIAMGAGKRLVVLASDSGERYL